MITYIPHLITLVLCIGILVLASINLRLTCRNQESLRILIFMALSWQTVVILFFMYNQTLWVIKEHTTVGKLSSMAHVRLC